MFAQACYDTVRTEEALETLQNWEQLEGLTPEITAQMAYLLVIMGNPAAAQPAVQTLLATPRLNDDCLRQIRPKDFVPAFHRLSMFRNDFLHACIEIRLQVGVGL